jgi:hypothetical protein
VGVKGRFFSVLGPVPTPASNGSVYWAYIYHFCLSHILPSLHALFNSFPFWFCLSPSLNFWSFSVQVQQAPYSSEWQGLLLRSPLVPASFPDDTSAGWARVPWPLNLVMREGVGNYSNWVIQE